MKTLLYRIIHNDIYVVFINILLLSGIIAATFTLVSSHYDILTDNRQHEVKEFVYSGYRVAEFYNKLAETGQLSQEAAKQRAIQVLSSMSYGDHRYFFVFTPQGEIILHPQLPAGSELPKDHFARDIFPLVRDAAINNFDGGFTQHKWPRPSTGAVEDKLTFSRYYREWNWVIGSGAFVSDVHVGYHHEVLRAVGASIAASSIVGLLLFFMMFVAYVRRCPLCKQQTACKFIHPDEMCVRPNGRDDR
jgi:methyl-accepting chemotaxis protein